MPAIACRPPVAACHSVLTLCESSVPGLIKAPGRSSWTRSKRVRRQTPSSTCRRPADPASRLSHSRLPGRVGCHADAARAAIECPRSTLTGIHSSASSMAAAVPSSSAAAAAVAALKEAPAMPNAVRSRLGSSSASRREAAIERAAGGGDAAEGRAECGGACEPAVQLLRGRARASLSVGRCEVVCRRMCAGVHCEHVRCALRDLMITSCCVPALVE